MRPTAGGPEHGTDEVGRRAEGEGDPVALGAARGQQGAGGPALAVLGVGRVQQLDGGGVRAIELVAPERRATRAA